MKRHEAHDRSPIKGAPMTPPGYLPADWPAPPGVRAFTSLRRPEAAGDFNLADHVGDDPQRVRQNRERLMRELQLPVQPFWLTQVHSDIVVVLDEQEADADPTQPPAADASISRQPGRVCAVLTADCLPVFFSNTAGTEVAVAHAGWRGLHAGILSRTVAAMRSRPQEILACFGPAIGPASFEVGQDVFDAFSEKAAENRHAFVVQAGGKYLCDIYQLACIELNALGLQAISGGALDTFRDAARFFSHRRQCRTGEPAGRMASLIWLA